MMQVIKNLLKDSALYIAVLCTIAIAVLSLIDLSDAELDIQSSDKLSHIIAYFFLSLFWLYGLLKNTFSITKIIWIAVSCSIYGIIIEVLQTAITTYRTASYLDILANSTGILLSVLAFYLFEKKNLVN